MKATDEQILEELTYMPNATARRLGAEFDMTRQAMDARLRKLEANGVVESETIGSDVVWSRADRSVRGSAETDTLTAKVREDSSFSVDVEVSDHPDKPSMLVQGGRDGYQMDVWWGDRRQASNWVTFEQAGRDYPYDNRHPRTPDLDTDDDTVLIHDPEPRVPGMGFYGADIRIEFTERDGTDVFVATLSWTDDHGKEHEQTGVLPLADPREDRETFYALAYE